MPSAFIVGSSESRRHTYSRRLSGSVPAVRLTRGVARMIPRLAPATAILLIARTGFGSVIPSDAAETAPAERDNVGFGRLMVSVAFDTVPNSTTGVMW